MRAEYLEDLRAAVSAIPVKELEGKRVLITGVTGLIGSCVADMLLQLKAERELSVDIVLAGRNEKRVRDRFCCWSAEYDFAYIDLLDSEALVPEADYYIHCAGNAHPVAYAQYPVETMLGNVLGTRVILDRVKRLGHGRLLYLSSSEVYGSAYGLSAYSEDDYGFVDVLNPRSCYPSSKRFVETLCASYKSEYNVDFVIARPGHIYGPTYTNEDTRVHALFAREAIAGEPIVLKSDGSQVRSYCYVTDCASALLTILLYGKTGNAYNISNSDSIISIRVLAELFAKEGGVDLMFENPDDRERNSFNPMMTSKLNASKLEALGWRPLIRPEEGVRKVLIGLD